MNKSLLCALLLVSFAQAVEEVVTLKNGVVKSDGGEKISYTHHDVDGTLKRYIKRGNVYALKSKFSATDEKWNKIGINPHYIIQGYQALEKTFNGTPTPTPTQSSNNNN